MITRINVNGMWVDTADIGLDYESARDATPQWYGVSHGNGNDGVSHMYPDYFVRTCDPYRLAELAVVATFKPEGQAWAAESVEVDGEAEYCVSGVIYNPPELCDDGSEWCDSNGAYHITEVWPVSADDMADSTAPEYESLADCFGTAFLARHTA